MDTIVTATSGGTVPVYPAQEIGPCAGSRYGEITTLIGAAKPTVVKGDESNRYLDDPNLDSCVPPTVRYVGMTEQPVYRFWQMYLQINIALSKPSPRQQAAGEHWVACIVTLPLPQPAAATATAPASTAPRYGGSIRNAMLTGQQRDQLSACTADLDWDSGIGVGGCSQPHSLELLAGGDSGDRPVARVQIEKTCLQLVRQLTAMPDPTAAGALSVQVHAEDNTGVAITTSQIPAHSNLTCAVATTGTRKLRGSLRALGRQPIPWA